MKFSGKSHQFKYRNLGVKNALPRGNFIQLPVERHSGTQMNRRGLTKISEILRSAFTSKTSQRIFHSARAWYWHDCVFSNFWFAPPSWAKDCLENQFFPNDSTFLYYFNKNINKVDKTTIFENYVWKKYNKLLYKTGCRFSVKRLAVPWRFCAEYNLRTLCFGRYIYSPYFQNSLDITYLWNEFKFNLGRQIIANH